MEVKLGDRKAEVIRGALAVEDEEGEGESRMGVNVSVRQGSLIIRVEAEDSSSLRAALNSHLNWLYSLTELLDGLDTPDNGSGLPVK